MTIRQTIDIPANRKVHIDLMAPEIVPCGKTDVILEFPQEPEVRLRQSCRNREELIAASDRRLAAEKTDPSLRSLKRWHGILKNSKTWGRQVDVEAEIRKMRDEWPDYWEINLSGLFNYLYLGICHPVRP
jgi:hypothetical protein